MEFQELINYILSTLLGAGITWLKTSKIIKNLRIDRNNLAAALAYREGNLLPPIHPKDQEIIDSAMDDLMAIHGVDRIATMWACNGTAAPTETTSISVKNKTGAHEEYYRTVLDSHYVSYLLAAERNGHHVLSTAKIPVDSVLGGIYRDVGVRHVVIVPLYYETNEAYGIKGWLYMSCAKYSEPEFSQAEIRAILAACALKGVLYQKAKLNQC